MKEEILLLEIDSHCYGLSVKHVREVLRAVALSPVPSADGFAEGVLNLRGRSVPVIDVRRRFGFPQRSIEPSDYLIVMESGKRLSAIRADRAVELLPIDAAHIEPADTDITSQVAVCGIVKFDARIVYLLDPEQLHCDSPDDRLGHAGAVDDPQESRS